MNVEAAKATSRLGYQWRRAKRNKQGLTEDHAAILKLAANVCRVANQMGVNYARMEQLEVHVQEHSIALDDISSLGHVLFCHCTACSSQSTTFHECPYDSCPVSSQVDDSSLACAPAIPDPIIREMNEMSGRSPPSSLPRALRNTDLSYTDVLEGWTMQKDFQRENPDQNMTCSGAHTPPAAHYTHHSIFTPRICADDRANCQYEFPPTAKYENELTALDNPFCIDIGDDNDFEVGLQRCVEIAIEKGATSMYIGGLIRRATKRSCLIETSAIKIQRCMKAWFSRFSMQLQDMMPHMRETRISMAGSSSSELSEDSDEPADEVESVPTLDLCAAPEDIIHRRVLAAIKIQKFLRRQKRFNRREKQSKTLEMNASAQPFLIDEAVQQCEKCRKSVYASTLTQVTLATPTAPALRICSQCLLVLKRWNSRRPGLCPRDVRNWIGRSPAVIRFEISRAIAARMIQKAWRRRDEDYSSLAHCPSCGTVSRMKYGSTICVYCSTVDGQSVTHQLSLQRGDVKTNVKRWDDFDCPHSSPNPWSCELCSAILSRVRIRSATAIQQWFKKGIGRYRHVESSLEEWLRPALPA